MGSLKGFLIGMRDLGRVGGMCVWLEGCWVG